MRRGIAPQHLSVHLFLSQPLTSYQPVPPTFTSKPEPTMASWGNAGEMELFLPTPASWCPGGGGRRRSPGGVQEECPWLGLRLYSLPFVRPSMQLRER